MKKSLRKKIKEMFNSIFGNADNADLPIFYLYVNFDVIRSVKRVTLSKEDIPGNVQIELE